MKYKGIALDFILPNRDMPRLYEYINDIEIEISYDRENPFCIKQIAILLDKEYNAYDVFECDIPCSYDVEAKAYAKDFAENLIHYRHDFAMYHNNKLSKRK